MQKQKLKNSFKTHLHCASLSDELWAGIEEFFQAWKDKKILKQPKGDLKQTHLISWTKCDENVKNELLHDVIRGDISFGRFKDRCSIRKKTTKDAEKQQTKKRQHIEDEDLNADEDNENEHQEMLNTDDEPSVRPGARLTSDDLDPNDDYKQALGNVRTKLMIEENRNEELEAENAQLKLELEQVHLIRFSNKKAVQNMGGKMPDHHENERRTARQNCGARRCTKACTSCCC